MSDGSFAGGTDAGDDRTRDRDFGGSIPMTTTSSTTGGSGGTGVDQGAVEAAAAAVAASAPSVQVNYAPQVTIVDQSAVKTVEGQRAFGRVVVAEVERALDQSAGGLEAKISRIARREFDRG
jgi:hypothetical protein